MTGVTIEQMKEGFSKPRNRALANAFAYMNLIEKWGSGIPNMLKACQAYGLPDVEFIDFESAIRINMYRKTIEDMDSVDQANEKHEPLESKGSKNELLDEPLESKGLKNELLGIFGAKMLPKVQLILKILREEPTSTQRELSQRTNMSVSTIKRILLVLQQKGVMRRKDGKRFGHWEILI